MNIEEQFKEWKKRLAINIHDLHNDVATQPSYYADVAEVAAELKAEVQLAKSNLELAKAEINSDARKNPGKHGLDKVTEGAIQTAVTLDEHVIEAQEAYALACHQHNMMEVLVTAFEHRRSMINNEVQLYSNNYWGEMQATAPGSQDGKAVMREERMKNIQRKRASS